MPPKTKKAKENVPPRKKVEEIADDFDDMEAEVDVELDPVPVKKVKPLKAKKMASVDIEEHVASPRQPLSHTAQGSFEKRLAAMTAERDRAVRERETIVKQFEELSNLRHSRQEGLLDKFKEQTAAVAKAQADVIANQTALNEKLVAKVSELEKALVASRAATQKAEDKAAAAEAPPALEGKLDGKSSKELHNEVFKLRSALKSKEEALTSLQREYDQEVAQSRKLQKEQRPSVSTAPASAPTIAASSEESEKDQESLKLYEDLTGLTILNVRLKGDMRNKEVTMTCMQTTDDRSFAFKLFAYKEYDRDLKKWVRHLEFTPDSLENERDKNFIARLGPFAQGFNIHRDQVQAAWEQLRLRMSREGKFDDPASV